MSSIDLTQVQRDLEFILGELGILKNTSSSGGTTTIVEPGTPDGSCTTGDSYFDSTDNELYICSGGEYVKADTQLFIRYASAVDFTGESEANIRAGIVTSQGDVTDFTSLPFDVLGNPFEFRGLFTGKTPSTDPTDYTWTSVKGANGLPAVYTSVLPVSGSPDMRNNTGSVTWKATLIVGATTQPDEGVGSSRINSYEWKYTPVGSTTPTTITNGNLDSVTGTTSNTSTGTDAEAFNHHSLIVEADGTALGTVDGGGSAFICDIDYT